MAFFKFFDFRSSRVIKPDVVIEVRPDDYGRCHVLRREESLVLYEHTEPQPKNGPAADQTVYDIVLHRESNKAQLALSVCRGSDLQETETQFSILKEKLPRLLQCLPDTSKDSIQEVVDLCRNNTSWSLTHVAAHLGLCEILKNPALTDEIDKAAADTGQTPLHVAIKAQKLLAVQTLVQLGCRLDAVDGKGDTMYHCAATTTKDIIKALSLKPVPIGLINKRNRATHTPLQLACLTDKAECVKELLKEGADVNSASAAKADDDVSPRCLDKSASVGGDFQEEDMKHGGTPLHWAKSTEVLQTMIDFGCDVSARNFQENTALHIMAARNRLNCVVLLLSNGADVNAVGMDGESPLHVAVKVAAPAADNWLPLSAQSYKIAPSRRKKSTPDGHTLNEIADVSVVQALIVFGADVDFLNKRGESPRHLAASSKNSKRDLVLYTLHAVGAARCTDDVVNCSDGCSSLGCFDGIAPPRPNFYKSTPLFDSLLGDQVVKEALENISEAPRRGKQCRALALDGGGVKGLITIRMMMSLEQMAGIPFIKCFDWIAGTSTGGILALCLATGKSAKQCFQIYFRLKEKVFIKSRPYSSEPLENLLKKELGEDKKMIDIPYPKLAITAVAASHHPAKLQLFRNYASPRNIIQDDVCDAATENESDPAEQLIWNVARATGAAPTYFHPYKHYVDGGLISNNPTQDLLTEIIEFNAVQKAIEADHEVANLQVMVSLGTGKPPVVPVTTIESLQGYGLFGVAKLAYSAGSLVQLVVDQATQTCGRVVDRTQAWCHAMRVPYFRLNPEQSEELVLNENDNRKILPLLWETMVYMRNRRTELAHLVKLLQPCADSPSLSLQASI